ncbi:MAG: type II toxin-antitoxin system prevent-host-death family antitoxin [Opitutaceae bacterium]|nr:type II toxin-antitoxin system prevent-host-death family antitoxin [Opitutaceae bacterium]
MKASARTVGAFEAKNKFSELLDRVSRGAEITITKHDRPVARLVPAAAPGRKERKKSTAELRVLRERYSLKGLSVRELIDAGRK